MSDRSSQLHSACAGPHCQHAELAVHRERSVGGRQVGGATPRLGLSLIAHHSSPSPPSAGPVRVVAPQPGRSRVIPISCARLQRPQRCPGQAPALCRSQGVTAGAPSHAATPHTPKHSAALWGASSESLTPPSNQPLTPSPAQQAQLPRPTQPQCPRSWLRSSVRTEVSYPAQRPEPWTCLCDRLPGSPSGAVPPRVSAPMPSQPTCVRD